MAENLKAAENDDKILIEFIHTPAYSPSLNLAEYEIHLLRLEKLHHLSSNTSITEIEAKLKDVHILINLEQISKTLGDFWQRTYPRL